MIATFTGEFLQHPVPFEMSESLCSHRCVYCFAGVREKKPQFKLNGFIAQMNRYQARADSWLFRKLREGYPVCLSNNTDPFSDNNEAFSESVLEYFKLNNIRVFFQTKGGRRATELIKAYGLRSVVYVTITTDRDDISKRIEPGAPPTSERIQMIKDLIRYGNEVIVGLNPLHSTWISDERVDDLMKQLHDIGVYSFVLAPLMIRKKRITLYAQRDFAGIDVTDRGGIFKDLNYFIPKIIRLEEEHKYRVIAQNHPFETQAFDIVKDVYGGKCLATQNDFFRKVGLQAGTEITRDDWIEWFVDSFNAFFEGGQGVNLLSYLFVQSKNEYTKHCKEAANSLTRMASWYFDIMGKPYGFIEKITKDKYLIKKRLSLSNSEMCKNKGGATE